MNESKLMYCSHYSVVQQVLENYQIFFRVVVGTHLSEHILVSCVLKQHAYVETISLKQHVAYKCRSVMRHYCTVLLSCQNSQQTSSSKSVLSFFIDCNAMVILFNGNMPHRRVIGRNVVWCTRGTTIVPGLKCVVVPGSKCTTGNVPQ